MAVKFSTCYPVFPHGGKTPCGIVTDQQSGMLQEIICPGVSAAVCAGWVAKWNDQCAVSSTDGDSEDTLSRFISDEAKLL